MNTEKKGGAKAARLSLTACLTAQLQEIICMGPGHLVTWANNRSHPSQSGLTRQGTPYEWMQVSVQRGTTCYLMLQFTLPARFGEAIRPHLDHLFAQHGWTNAQPDGRECLIYSVAQSENARKLLDEAESVALRCAAVMERLWQAHSPNDIAMLGVRGPRTAPKARSVTHSLPQALICRKQA